MNNTNRDELYIYHWERKYAKGKWTYIILSTLVWGSFWALGIQAFILASDGLFRFDFILDAIFDIEFLFFWLMLMCIVFFVAWSFYTLSKKKYLSLKKKLHNKPFHYPSWKK
jgi:hypothetical protein